MPKYSHIPKKHKHLKSWFHTIMEQDNSHLLIMNWMGSQSIVMFTWVTHLPSKEDVTIDKFHDRHEMYSANESTAELFEIEVLQNLRQQKLLVIQFFNLLHTGNN